jgi:pimeloyl-ACP methyl ester carboxylesterase
MSVTKRIRRDKPCPLPPEERDRHLLDGAWPNLEGLENRWSLAENGDSLSRVLSFDSPPGGKSDGIEKANETILRFPSAPVYGTHRPRSHTYEIKDQWPNYHTMRVLTRPDMAESGVKQVFLLHNGLNETKDIGFHYRLASWILAECEDAACIIRPLPGHLSRYPFQSPFTGLPLDDYLLDPALVFRQFLRYMLETQWLLSAIVPRNDYRVATGCDLLLYKAEPGRESDEALAKEITVQANRALKASEKVGNHNKEELVESDVRSCIETLRELLGWSAIDREHAPEPARVDRPAVHAVGYSMGGFIAQAVFCTWPFAVASCSNMFAGGALRDLAPTAFAHPEEWQSVLHGLRSELDQARVEKHFARTKLDDEGLSPTVGEQVVGIERGTFEYFSHVFDDVFLQVNAGSYSTRLAEFSRRLLFILGGDDPIVRTQKVLDAAPPGGVTLHQIGDLSHFPSKRKSEPAEREQREFWLPEAGKMIGRFATRAASLLQQTNSRCWLDESGVRSEDRTIEPEPLRPDRRVDWALPNLLFEHELDAVVAMLGSSEEEAGGWLFISRNQIPTAFLEGGAYRAYGAAMHHAEDLIGDYVRSIGMRAETLSAAKERISLLIPSDQVATTGAFDWIHDRARFSKSESAMRVSLNPEASGELVEDFATRLMEHFAQKWCSDGVVRVVDADEYLAADLEPIGPIWAKHRNNEFPRISLTMLPDMWMAFSKEACLDLLGASPAAGREAVESGMIELACKLAEDPKVRPHRRNEASRLHGLRRKGAIRTVEVSGAELNPRYRGRVLDDGSDDTMRVVTQLITHWAIAHRASREYAPAT